MEIQSAFNAGVQGFQKATEDANKAASNIVSSTVTEAQSLQASAQQTPAENVQTQSAPTLTQSVVDLKVAEYQAKGSAEVVQAADETLGTLLDVRV
jgi:hypothetical protein